ncbi:MAG: tetraacyldisaccharide 4'-kinase [Robiginitomaculum sp.]|nr:MAG: tetraacyldisaccharide 4'-kinase [Robiginitomaculum sp.]
MRAPEFWNHKYGRESAPMLRTLLSPLGWLYARATAKRLADADDIYDPHIPVISVGNASVGGTGKTPVSAYLLESLTRMGVRACVVTRGYGGREKGPMIVTKKHTAAQMGDEPLLLARHGRVWVAMDRGDGGRAAAAQGAQIIILDDGHQNPSLVKTLSLLVVDAEIGFGNEYVFPAGPLREPVKAALERTDAVILMKPYSEYKVDEDLLTQLKGKMVISASLRPSMAVPAGKLYAFAGIGRPNKFFDALLRAGADLVESMPYANHYTYKETDMKDLLELSQEYGAKLITTEKDYVRLPKAIQKLIHVWPVSVEFEDELSMRRLLHPLLPVAKR